MSVHKSKGLEFPVVFLAELNGQFNLKNISGDCLTDANLAMGLTVIESNSKTKLKSLGHQVVAEQIQKTTLAEEMRILYVAMTRASYKLILTASEKASKCRQIIQSATIAGRILPDWQISSARNFLQWILSALAGEQKLNDIFETNGKCLKNDRFELYLHSAETFDKLYNQSRGPHHHQNKETFDKAQIPEILSQLKNNLSWRYPFEEDTRSSAKKSVSELTHSSDEFAEIKYRQPFISSQKTTETQAKQIGTAAHLLIQKLDLSKPINSETIKAIKDDLIVSGIIAEQTAKKINCSSIEKFFNTDLGAAALDPDNIVFREWPFTFAVKPDSSDEKMIVQGIIDMLIKTPAGLIIVDFKTDHVNPGQTQDRAQIYKSQINFYSAAASAILKCETISSWLYFLSPAIAIQCPE